MASLKQDYEAYLVVIRHVHGERKVERKVLNVPLDVATNNLERLSALQLRELTNDCIAEDERRGATIERRAEIENQTGSYDPLASQITRRAT